MPFMTDNARNILEGVSKKLEFSIFRLFSAVVGVESKRTRFLELAPMGERSGYPFVVKSPWRVRICGEDPNYLLWCVMQLLEKKQTQGCVFQEVELKQQGWGCSREDSRSLQKRGYDRCPCTASVVLLAFAWQGLSNKSQAC